ncbi:hypothetical protein EYF80_020199 [Liparis tanakae]|uniref:Uncharacterized protein n=1 Tax=Liparis tanakae TaxID=230148 RepID=A0A4Z2HX01_9TELE|nr:hypothetical protein EYF80_020199 [Liparis tanakae]
MLACCSLLLTWLMLATGVLSQRPCTDLLPLDLLARVLPRSGQAPPPQVVQVGGMVGGEKERDE